VSKYNLDKVHDSLLKMGLVDFNANALTQRTQNAVHTLLLVVAGDNGMLDCEMRLDEIDEDIAFDLRQSLANFVEEWLVTIALPVLEAKNDLRLALSVCAKHDMAQHRCIRGANFVSCSCGFHATREHDSEGIGYLFRIDYETKARARIYRPDDPNIMSESIRGFTESHVGHCDKCGREDKPIRSIAYTTYSTPVLGDSHGNIHVCRTCFAVEMSWRISRNLDLRRQAFYVFAWDEADPAKSPDMVQSYHEENSVDNEDSGST